MSGDEKTSSARRATPFGPFGSGLFGAGDHLATEVVAAYVDGELRMTAYLRASQHLAVCAECAAEVEAQQQARVALRQAHPVCAPSTLFAALAQIPGELAREASQAATARFDADDTVMRRFSHWLRR
jgi:anti-sigma factor RsiW